MFFLSFMSAFSWFFGIPYLKGEGRYSLSWLTSDLHQLGIMPLIVVYISVFVSSVAVSSHAQGLIDIALQCGPDHLQFAENQAVQCTPGDDSVYCFGAFSGLNITQARACSSLTDSSSCMSSCREFLHDTVDDGGCHVDTVFNPRFSLLVLRYFKLLSTPATLSSHLPVNLL